MQEKIPLNHPAITDLILVSMECNLISKKVTHIICWVGSTLTFGSYSSKTSPTPDKSSISQYSSIDGSTRVLNSLSLMYQAKTLYPYQPKGIVTVKFLYDTTP